MTVEIPSGQLLPKLERGSKVAIVSLSWAASAVFPKVFELGLSRLIEEFDLIPVEYPTTRMLDAPVGEKIADLISAFTDSEIKAVFASIGGDHQVTFIKTLEGEIFRRNPKPFFGYSDNSHFSNFLFNHGIPSYYGGHIMTQFGMNVTMDEYTKHYLRLALFGPPGRVELMASETFNEVGLDWAVDENLHKPRRHRPNSGWRWQKGTSLDLRKGILWGGCLEVIDDMLRNAITLPNIADFEQIILFTETSEEIPDNIVVKRTFRALGERGILERCKGFLVGRPKASEFFDGKSDEQCDEYRERQYETIVTTIRAYNKSAPIVLNVDFGHTDPQICIPYGGVGEIDTAGEKLFIHY